MNVKCHACIGGKSLGNDLKQLEKGGVQVVSGTPGRVFDLIRRTALSTANLKAMILDEGALGNELSLNSEDFTPVFHLSPLRTLI